MPDGGHQDGKHQRNKDHCRDGDRTQHRVQVHHQDQGPDHGDGAVDKADRTGGGGLPQQHGVAGDPSHHFAGRSCLQWRQPGPQEATDHALAGVVDDVLRQRPEHDPLPPAQDGADDDQPRQQHDRRAESVARHADRVQHPSRDQGCREFSCRHTETQREAEGELATVWTGKPPQHGQLRRLLHVATIGRHIDGHGKIRTYMSDFRQVMTD